VGAGGRGAPGLGRTAGLDSALRPRQERAATQPTHEDGAVLRRHRRRSAAFGYEHRAHGGLGLPAEAVHDFKLAFRLEGYPLDIDGVDTAVWIDVRPEATVLTYAHAAFTVRQTIFAPQHEPAVAMLLDVESALPLTVIGSFRPRLKLMWPAGLMTGNAGWDEKERVYSITEETNASRR
jgi:hypothetical protein